MTITASLARLHVILDRRRAGGGLRPPLPLDRGARSHDRRLGAREEVIDWFQRYLDALVALRPYELAGDWSKYDEAGVAAMRASVAERIAGQEKIIQDIVGKVRREREDPYQAEGSAP
jgi:hypothetical protein